jgi:hypothetical protein
MRPAFEQQIKQSKFVCTACGGGRDRDCNAPAMEREAARKEANRQANQRLREKKRQEKQQARDITPEEPAPSEDWKKKIALGIIDQAYHQVAEVRELLLIETVDDHVIEEIRHTVNEWRSLFDAAVEARASIVAPGNGVDTDASAEAMKAKFAEDLSIPESLRRN